MTFTTKLVLRGLHTAEPHVSPLTSGAFDVASRVPPTQLLIRGNLEAKICGKGKRTEMHRENTSYQPFPGSVISIADASDRKCEWASCISNEFEHCLRPAHWYYCTAKCGSLGSSAVQWSESTVDTCGIRGFSLITAKCQSEDVVVQKQNKA